MEIKDCAIINIELLKCEVAVLRKNCEIFREFNDHQAVSSRMRVINTIESIIEKSTPLTPIIQDAWNCNNSTLSDYLEEKEI